MADCFKFRSKIGLDVALEALQEAWRDKRVSMDEFWRYATLCRVANVMLPDFDATRSPPRLLNAAAVGGLEPPPDR